MGRGRAKAKQTKVARQLKYNSGGTDLDRLRAELLGDDPATRRGAASDDAHTAGEDEYDGYDVDGYADDADEADEADEDDEDD